MTVQRKVTKGVSNQSCINVRRLYQRVRLRCEAPAERTLKVRELNQYDFRRTAATPMAGQTRSCAMDIYDCSKVGGRLSSWRRMWAGALAYQRPERQCRGGNCDDRGDCVDCRPASRLHGDASYAEPAPGAGAKTRRSC